MDIKLDKILDLKNFKSVKSLFTKERITRTPHGYDVHMFEEFHRLNSAVHLMEKQIGELGINDYYDPMVLELKAKEQQRDIIFKRLKNDFYDHKSESAS